MPDDPNRLERRVFLALFMGGAVATGLIALLLGLNRGVLPWRRLLPW